MTSHRTSAAVSILFAFVVAVAGVSPVGGEKVKPSPTPSPDPRKVVAVSAGYDHVLALTEDGSVSAWGNNALGQLGTGDTQKRLVPVKVEGLAGVTAVSAGNGFSLALLSDGTVWGWGAADQGQLGASDHPKQLRPRLIDGITSVKLIKAAGSTVAAIRNDGTLWTWGAAGQGLLGTGTSEDRSTPERIQILRNMKDVSGAGVHFAALDSSGRLWSWGSNRNIQLGKVSVESLDKPAVTIEDRSGSFASICAGSYTLFCRKDGTVWMIGWNSINRTGNGSDPRKVWYKGEAQQVELSAKIVQVSCFDHALALDDKGRVWAWGENTLGQCGNGTQRPVESPEKIEGLPQVAYVGAGRRFSVALSTEGALYAWGDNSFGQLGDATVRERLSPVRVMGFE
ncbi:MAG: hypothetical protein Kow00107_05170 [Planctomycetota bacterium]